MVTMVRVRGGKELTKQSTLIAASFANSIIAARVQEIVIPAMNQQRGACIST